MASSLCCRARKSAKGESEERPVRSRQAATDSEHRIQRSSAFSRPGGCGSDGRGTCGTRGTADLFGFLTADANQEVGAVHPKAMPVILTREEEREAWMAAPWTEAVRLLRPLPDGTLRIVARGEKKDEAMLLGEAEA